MSVNRKLWKPPFDKLPNWLCPSCQSGMIALNNDTLKCTETGPSREAHAHSAWEPEWITERFSGLLVCQNASCGELVAIGGDMQPHCYQDEDEEEVWVPKYKPVFIHPAPPIFSIPEKCPEPVAVELRKAFALFWSDTGSCTNRLRAAAEALLTERKVPRTTISKNGKRERISLHARIEKFKQIDAGSANYLIAIKWLGNAGSHANLDQLGGDELLNGFELFEHVVERIYVKREEHLKRIANGINSERADQLRSAPKSYSGKVSAADLIGFINPFISNSKFYLTA